MRISDWSSDVCSSDLEGLLDDHAGPPDLPVAVRLYPRDDWRLRLPPDVVRRLGDADFRPDRVLRTPPRLRPGSVRNGTCPGWADREVVVAVDDPLRQQLASVFRQPALSGGLCPDGDQPRLPGYRDAARQNAGGNYTRQRGG